MRVKNFRRLFLEWKRGLMEDEAPALSEGSRISFGEINALFKLFHLSEKLLGEDEQFQFTPKIPRSPFMDDSGNYIEDDFTKRISLGPTIEKCQEALESPRAIFLYGGDIKNYVGDDVEVVSTSVWFKACDKMLSSKGNEYGPEFNFDAWSEDYVDSYHDELTGDDAEQIATADKPSRLPDEERHMFYACIPDSPKTSELWSKAPLNLYFLGVISKRESVVRLSPAGAKVITVARKYQGTT